MAPGCHHPAMLVCSVYDFYPKQIKVSWLRNGQETTSDITSTEEFANGDWLYQVHSHLEYMPRWVQVKPGTRTLCLPGQSDHVCPLLDNSTVSTKLLQWWCLKGLILQLRLLTLIFVQVFFCGSSSLTLVWITITSHIHSSACESCSLFLIPAKTEPIRVSSFCRAECFSRNCLKIEIENRKSPRLCLILLKV